MMNIYKSTQLQQQLLFSDVLGELLGLVSLFPEGIPGFVPCCRGEHGTASTGCCSGGRFSAPTTIRVQETFPAEGK